MTRTGSQHAPTSTFTATTLTHTRPQRRNGRKHTSRGTRSVLNVRGMIPRQVVRVIAADERDDLRVTADPRGTVASRVAIHLCACIFDVVRCCLDRPVYAAPLRTRSTHARAPLVQTPVARSSAVAGALGERAHRGTIARTAHQSTAALRGAARSNHVPHSSRARPIGGVCVRLGGWSDVRGDRARAHPHVCVCVRGRTREHMVARVRCRR